MDGLLVVKFIKNHLVSDWISKADKADRLCKQTRKTPMYRRMQHSCPQPSFSTENTGEQTPKEYQFKCAPLHIWGGGILYKSKCYKGFNGCTIQKNLQKNVCCPENERS